MNALTHATATLNRIQTMRVVISNIQSGLVNMSRHLSPGCDLSITKARRSLKAWADYAEVACDEANANWAPICEHLLFKAASRDMFAARCLEAVEKLADMDATLAQREQEETQYITVTTTTEEAEAMTTTTETTTETPFITRAVTALDAGDTGENSVYVHWFRIDYGCWLDAEAVVLAGGLADYLESIGLSSADVAELMTQDWDCQDAEGLAARCLGNYGGFDWKMLEELMEVSVPAEILAAGLDAGLDADAIEDAYMGEWSSAEDMAFDYWDETGMLDSIPDGARGYIDWAMVARDMLMSGIVESKGHYFHQH